MPKFLRIPYLDENMEIVRKLALKNEAEIYQEILDDLRHMRNIGFLSNKVYDAYIELYDKYYEKLEEIK